MFVWVAPRNCSVHDATEQKIEQLPSDMTWLISIPMELANECGALYQVFYLCPRGGIVGLSERLYAPTQLTNQIADSK